MGMATFLFNQLSSLVQTSLAILCWTVNHVDTLGQHITLSLPGYPGSGASAVWSGVLRTIMVGSDLY